MWQSQLKDKFRVPSRVFPLQHARYQMRNLGLVESARRTA